MQSNNLLLSVHNESSSLQTSAQEFEDKWKVRGQCSPLFSPGHETRDRCFQPWKVKTLHMFSRRLGNIQNFLELVHCTLCKTFILPVFAATNAEANLRTTEWTLLSEHAQKPHARVPCTQSCPLDHGFDTGNSHDGRRLFRGSCFGGNRSISRQKYVKHSPGRMYCRLSLFGVGQRAGTPGHGVLAMHDRGDSFRWKATARPSGKSSDIHRPVSRLICRSNYAEAVPVLGRSQKSAGFTPHGPDGLE